MKERHSFKGTIGFVLAAAGSAVGLGNLWRFPYLAAKDGGALFLIIYLILALTFGFALMTTEIAIGRKTKQSPLTAYDKVRKGWKPLGIIASLVPFIILPYYCVIGGWVVKYFVVFAQGAVNEAAADGYFTGFITADVSPIIYLGIFLACVAFIVIRGVNKGIEDSSRIIMPILLVILIIIAVYSLTISHTDAEGVTRTGLQGLKVYLVPNLDGITFRKLFSIVFDAVGQLFYSLSVAMGILVAYGSYVSDDANLVSSINQIEIFDTAVAILAGAMIIPAVYTFMGPDGMSAGPGLMFVTLPKVFVSMGTIGRVIGAAFFALVFFAALTSAVSVMEAVVSSIIDEFHLHRTTAAVIETVIAALLGILVCLGYNKLYFEYTLPNGAVAQILDIMDYVSNNIFMPITAIATCVLIGWIMKPRYVLDEVEKTGHKFGREKLYIVMIRYIAPVLLVVLFLKAVGLLPML